MWRVRFLESRLVLDSFDNIPCMDKDITAEKAGEEPVVRYFWKAYRRVDGARWFSREVRT